MEGESPNLPIDAWLESLQLSHLADWDVLVFLYRHRASLVSAEQIARLVGYTTSAVGEALEVLESRKLVQRSRASQGVRLYEFSDSTSPSHDSFQQLMSLAESRAGRLLLAQKLRERAGRRRARSTDALHLVKGNAVWPIAI